MKITIFSDTHRNFHKLKSAVSQNLDSDLFIHLGDGQHELYDVAQMYSDKEFIFVKGNTDFGSAPEERVLELPSCKIFCAHGHKLDVHTSLEQLVDKALFHECKIALFGHTHLFRTEFVQGVYVMNPGSLDSPRGKNPATYGVIEIADDQSVVMNIVEYAPNV